MDGYKANYEQGKELNDDQKAAIAKYDEVMHGLEFSRELTGQFKTIADEEAKNRKKQLKKEQHDRIRNEIGRVATILGVQHVLRAFAVPKVKADFASGENGALKLTKDQLTMIEDFSKLVETSVKNLDETDKVLTPTAEHLISLAEGKPKKVGKTNYKDLLTLFNNIRACKYFKTVDLVAVAAASSDEATPKKEKSAKGNRGDKKHHNGKNENREDKQQVSPQQPPVVVEKKEQPPMVNNKPVVPMPTGSALPASTLPHVFPPPPNLPFVPPVTSGLQQHQPHTTQSQPQHQQPPINFLQVSKFENKNIQADFLD